ncbi:8-oxoguanine glycosylase ogg1, partial [Massospora cicadina]
MWHFLKVSSAELQLEATLRAGQTFHWVETGPLEWAAAFEGMLISLRQDELGISFLGHSENLPGPEVIAQRLKDYFQLDFLCLEEQYRRWSEADPYFKLKAVNLPGVRILRQDPVEALLAFICSSNNNLPRISQL